MSPAFQNVARPLLIMALVGLGYYVTGRLGLLLAIPPGYATAVWPPSGVALTALLACGLQYWPGVLIGSLAVNLFTSFDASDPSTMALSAGIASIIALGAAIQAAVSAWLVNRFVPRHSALEQSRDIGWLILLGGPVGCLIASTVGVTTLMLAGKLPWQHFGFTWLTWWVGDTIGVVVFTPVLLLLMQPRRVVSIHRKLVVAVALCATFAITIYVFTLARQSEQHRQQLVLEQQAQGLKQNIDSKLQSALDILRSIEYFFGSSDYVSAHEFKTFVDKLFIYHPDIHALTWNRKVTDAERPAFEKEIQEQGFSNFGIKDRPEGSELVVSPSRDFYFPITYAEVIAGDVRSYGFDTYTDPERRRTMDIARDTGWATITSRIDLSRDGQKQTGVIIYHPIYGHDAQTDNVSERRKNLIGFTSGIFFLPELMKDISQIVEDENLYLTLSDNSAAADHRLLYDSRPQTAMLPSSPAAAAPEENKLLYHIGIGGRDWVLEVRPSNAYLMANRTWSVWFVLAGGLMFCGLFGAFLLLVTGRTDVVQRLVEKKTHEVTVQGEHLKLLLRKTPAAVAMFDNDMRYLMTSERWMTDYQFGDQDLTGRSHYDVFPEIRDIPEWVEVHRRALRGEHIIMEEDCWQRDDGRTEWIKWAVHPWREADGKIGGIIMFTEVITARKEQAEALKSSEETFRAAMEYAPIGQAMMEPSGHWLKVNSALCALSGYSAEELMQTDVNAITHPDDIGKDKAQLKQLINGEIQTYQVEKRYFHKAGHIIWAQTSVSLVRNTDGTPKYFIAQIQDISERKHMERMKNEFVSTVSHELRTPLTSIRGSLGLVAGGVTGRLPDKAADLVKIAHKNSERLVRIINDILDIEKIESGKMEIHLQKIQVKPFLDSAIEANLAYGEKFQVRFALEEVPEDIEVVADPDRLMQVMANLMSNAAKFSKPGSEVKIRAQEDGKYLRFEVKDHGAGIPEEFRGRIFEKFAQADGSNTRRHEGTGLGLSITQRLVEAMGGEIGFNTKTDEGTTFFFRMPMVEHGLEVGIQPASVLPDNICCRVLICEDNHDIAVFMRLALEQAGFIPDVATTIGEARQKLASGHYAAVTLDLAMPDENGADFLNELRGKALTQDLPVVVVSATADTVRKTINGDAIGVVDWLTKPISHDKLVRSLHLTLEQAQDNIPRILHVEDDKDLSRVLAESMRGQANLISAPTLQEAEQLLVSQKFDLVVLDLTLPDGSGLELLQHLKTLANYPLPVLILSASETTADVQRRVAATLVKSRMSENAIVDTILSLVGEPTAHQKKAG